MYQATPDKLTDEVIPVLEACLPEDDLHRLIPVDFQDMDPLSEGEPSIGALVELDAGLMVVAVYGRDSHRLSLRLPEVSPKTYDRLLEEIPIPESDIVWRNEKTRHFVGRALAALRG
jgi:hypothetical protein